MDVATVYGAIGLAGVLLIVGAIALDALELGQRLGCRECSRLRIDHGIPWAGIRTHPYRPWVRGDRYAAALGVIVILWIALALAR